MRYKRLPFSQVERYTPYFVHTHTHTHTHIYIYIEQDFPSINFQSSINLITFNLLVSFDILFPFHWRPANESHTDPSGTMINIPSDIHTYDLPDLTAFVVQYLGQVTSDLGLPWTVTSRKRLREERMTPSDEVLVGWPFNTIIWGDVCASRYERDELRRRDLLEGVREVTANTSRHYGFALSSFFNEDSVKIEFIQLSPDGSTEMMGGRALKFTDQAEIERIIRDISERWLLPLET